MQKQPWPGSCHMSKRQKWSWPDACNGTMSSCRTRPWKRLGLSNGPTCGGEHKDIFHCQSLQHQLPLEQHRLHLAAGAGGEAAAAAAARGQLEPLLELGLKRS